MKYSPSHCLITYGSCSSTVHVVSHKISALSRKKGDIKSSSDSTFSDSVPHVKQHAMESDGTLGNSKQQQDQSSSNSKCQPSTQSTAHHSKSKSNKTNAGVSNNETNKDDRHKGKNLSSGNKEGKVLSGGRDDSKGDNKHVGITRKTTAVQGDHDHNNTKGIKTSKSESEESHTAVNGSVTVKGSAENGHTTTDGKRAGKGRANDTKGQPEFTNVVTGDIMVHEPVAERTSSLQRHEPEARAQLVTADENNKRPVRVIVVSKCYTTKL